MNSNQPSSKSVDEILEMMWGGGLDFASSDDFKNLSTDEKDKLYLTYQGNLKKEAKSNLYQLIKDRVINEDEPLEWPFEGGITKNRERNKLRASQRKALDELFEVKDDE